MILSDIRARIVYKNEVLTLGNWSASHGREFRGYYDHPTPRYDRFPVYKVSSGTKITYMYSDDPRNSTKEFIILKIEP